MKKVFAAAALSLCSLALLAGCAKSNSLYKAGTYTAAAAGYGGDVSVEVEFDKDSLLSVKVVSQDETPAIGGHALDTLPGEMVKAQTWDVDAIASATVTSDALKAAVKDCIDQASNQ